jgi:alkylhydroperoxidase family enzyme
MVSMIALPPTPRIAPRSTDADPPPLNIFRTLAHNRELYKAFLALGSHLLAGGGLPEREREIVILRTGWRCGSEYEFGQHTVIGARAGLTPEEIERLAHPAADGWGTTDRDLVALVDEMCSDDAVSDPTWARLAERWTEPQLLELLVLCGYYRLVSGRLNGVAVALEPTTPGWPAAAEAVRRAPREASA